MLILTVITIRGGVATLLILELVKPVLSKDPHMLVFLGPLFTDSSLILCMHGFIELSSIKEIGSLIGLNRSLWEKGKAIGIRI